MFRRLRSGLPKDPVFAKDLKGLGYFIDEKDEIKSIDNPKAYFKYFLTKNPRYNDMQRESMNQAIRDIVMERLEALGLVKIRLPLGASETDKHVPIYVSRDLKDKKEIIVLFGEACQDIGIFAHRVIGGKGGIDAGTAVGLIKYINSSAAKEGREAPGVILANMGQLFWSHRARKALTLVSWGALPRKSAADPPYDLDEYQNFIPDNKNGKEHVAYIFNSVLDNPKICARDSKIQIIGVSEGAVESTLFLHDPDNFSRWIKGVEPVPKDNWSDSKIGNHTKMEGLRSDGNRQGRVTALASVCSILTLAEDGRAANLDFLEISNPEFKLWYEDRGRTYAKSEEPTGTFLAPPTGAKYYMASGAPTFSLGEAFFSEKMLVSGGKTVIDWLNEVAADATYANPKLERFDFGGEDLDEADTKDNWDVPVQKWEEPGILESQQGHSLLENIPGVKVLGTLKPKADLTAEKEPVKIEETVSPGENEKPGPVSSGEAVKVAQTLPDEKPTPPLSTAPAEIREDATEEEKAAVEKLNNIFTRINGGGDNEFAPDSQAAELLEDADYDAGLTVDNLVI